MHKPTRTRLTVTEDSAAESKPDGPRKHSPFKKRSSRRPRNWNRILKGVALCLFLADAGALLFANPALRVTQVRVVGAQTLSPEQVYQEARVPARTNIFWMLRQPFAQRLQADPRVDYASRSIELPHRLVLTVAERQPRAILAGGGQFWLLDRKGIPYRQLDRPLPHLPIVQVAAAVLPDAVMPGRPLRAVWMPDALRLLTLLDTTPNLGGAKIVVDQNMNLCLNRRNGLQIRLGQPDALPLKVALASATVGTLATKAVYIDVSSPRQPVYRPRKETSTETDVDAGTPNRARNGPNGPESRPD